MDGTINDETTGIFVGTLLEDMIDTVTKTGRLYCDVDIPRFFNSTFNHPLTYVPLWAMTLPLKKGDKVFVKFHQDDFTLPLLWKIDGTVDEGMYKEYEPKQAVENGNIKKIEPVKTFYSQKLGDDSFIIKTENYTVIRQNDAYVLLDKDNNIFASGNTVNVSSSDVLNVDSGSTINIYTEGEVNIKQKGNSNFNIETDGKVFIKNNSYNLGQLLNDFTDFVKNDLLQALSSLHTEGSPYNHTATQWAAQNINMPVTGLISKIEKLQSNINQIFPKS